MSSMKKIKFSIYRYDPDKDSEPYMQDFDLDIDADADPMLLTLLIRLKDEKDESLSFRRSCREGVCGSDAMNVNGRNALACISRVSQFKQPIVIRPLPGFPVIRDLAVDMEQFYKQYAKVKPALINNDPAPAKERLQSPEDRAKLDGLYECILCACCSSSCPSYWWNPDKFLGPAALLQAWRFLVDTRDTARRERLMELHDPFSVFRCRSIMNCVDVCPKGLNPTKAIANIRTAMLKEEV